MRILRLRIAGFRSLKEVDWEPGNLNVIIGPNGSGKSNLLTAIQFIARAAEGQLGKTVQSAGGIGQLVWDGRADNISITLKTSPIQPGRNQAEDSMTYILELARLGLGGSYRIGRELLANYHLVDAGEKSEPFKFLERMPNWAKVFDPRQKALIAPLEMVPEEEALLSVAAGPFAANRLTSLFKEDVASWSVYHDLHTNRDAVIRQPAVARTETRVNPDGQNLIPVLHTLYTTNRGFRDDIHAAMRAAFGEDFEELVFPPAADQRIQLRVRWKTLNQEQSAADLSDGTLRFLFLLAVLASPTPAPVIAIDEPETGLHPSMLSIVAEHAVQASKRAQVIFATHSAQLLDAFGDVKPTTTVAKWSEGETTLVTLSEEKLAYWLKEYSLGGLYRSGELEGMA
ncbi:MAG TPA: AAA family ATPase [Symbiobacteriaceae bacterium]|jgi:predicted ATPase